MTSDEVDDWFDEPETGDVWSSRIDRQVRERQAQRDVDDWLGDRSTPTRERSARRRPARRTALAAAGLLVVLVLGVLAATGVFSGNGRPGASPSTPSSRSAPTTTASVTRPKALPLPAGPLKPGDHGVPVTQLQRALARVGDAPGAVDGMYGPSTTRAVKPFQQAHGLTADGVAGPKTLAALRQALQSG